MSCHPQPVHIDLSSGNIGDTGLEALVQQLKAVHVRDSLPRVISLTFDSNGITHRGLKILEEVLIPQKECYLPCLRALSLHENYIGATSSARSTFCSLAQSIAGHPTLHSLRLSNCGLGPQEAALLAGTLTKNSGLRKLDLSGKNSVSLRAGWAFHDQLKDNTTLTNLWITSESLTRSECWKQIQNMLARNQNPGSTAVSPKLWRISCRTLGEMPRPPSRLGEEKKRFGKPDRLNVSFTSNAGSNRSTPGSKKSRSSFGEMSGFRMTPTPKTGRHVDNRTSMLVRELSRSLTSRHADQRPKPTFDRVQSLTQELEASIMHEEQKMHLQNAEVTAELNEETRRNVHLQRQLKIYQSNLENLRKQHQEALQKITTLKTMAAREYDEELEQHVEENKALRDALKGLNYFAKPISCCLQ